MYVDYVQSIDDPRMSRIRAEMLSKASCDVTVYVEASRTATNSLRIVIKPVERDNQEYTRPGVVSKCFRFLIFLFTWIVCITWLLLIAVAATTTTTTMNQGEATLPFFLKSLLTTT